LAFSFTIHTSGSAGAIAFSGAGACDPEPPYVVRPPTFGISFVCRVRDIKRGDSKTFTFRIVPDFRDGRTYWSATLGWSSRISGMGEVDPSNQNGARQITGCLDRADPRCSQAAAGASMRLGL
jgi:hypothetical protein